MRTAEIEMVDYNAPAIIDATEAMTHGLSHYSGVEGIPDWTYAVSSIREIVEGRLAKTYEWHVPPASLEFTGFPNEFVELPNGRFRTSEPYFILKNDVNHRLTPSLKALMEGVTQAVLVEMEEKFAVRVERTPSLSVVSFPLEAYADDVKLVKGVIL